MTNSDHAWQTWGTRDPYYAVYSVERFRKAHFDEGAREEFFRSGQEHITNVLTTVRTHIDPQFRPSSALDFGCGVGRLLPPLARCCSRVVGVDVSEGMLSEAGRNMDQMQIGNVELVLSDDRLSRVTGTFDFVHSCVVFQHIPVRRGMAIVHELLSRLNDGGVAFFQFTYRQSRGPLRQAFRKLTQRFELLNSAVNVIRRAPIADPPMQMNIYDVNELLALFRAHGAENVYAHLVEGIGYSSVEFFLQKKKS